jgi:uncharacterized protein (DUF2126 family)
MSFETLEKDELYRVLVEDFAVNVKPTDSKKVLLAAATEDGVTWEMYKKAYPDTEPVVEEVVAQPVVTTGDIKGATADEVPVATPRIRTRAASEVQAESPDLYLIKMDRENLYFEFRGYKFTKDHPFAVMPAADADRILKNEDGFSIASPSEANEYYGRG